MEKKHYWIDIGWRPLLKAAIQEFDAIEEERDFLRFFLNDAAESQMK